MRPDALRMNVLVVMAGKEEYIEGKILSHWLTAAGVQSDPEKNRYVIKRLNDAGFLERRRVEGRNKYEFRLRALDELLKQYSAG